MPELRFVFPVSQSSSVAGRLSHYFSWLSYAPLTLALLRIDPVWDPLFQKLINEENP